MVFCALFAALVAAGAFIRIPLPGVPFTLQTTFVTWPGYCWAGGWAPSVWASNLLVGLVGIPALPRGAGRVTFSSPPSAI